MTWLSDYIKTEMFLDGMSFARGLRIRSSIHTSDKLTRLAVVVVESSR